MTGPYGHLLRLARLQAELVADGRLDEIAPLAAEFERVAATLPAEAPAEALAALEEADRLVTATVGALRASLAATGAEMAQLAQGRRAASGYGGPARSSLRVSA